MVFLSLLPVLLKTAKGVFPKQTVSPLQVHKLFKGSNRPCVLASGSSAWHIVDAKQMFA